MAKKKVTLSIDSEIYNKYRTFCDQNAIMLSKKIELFMKAELDSKKKERGK